MPTAAVHPCRPVLSVRGPLLREPRTAILLGMFGSVTCQTYLTIILLILSLLATGCCDGSLVGFDVNMCELATAGDEAGDTDVTGGIVWGEGDCCEQAGSVNGGTCLLSNLDGRPPACIGCDWEPVLCMQVGCAVPNAKDCCLNAEGQTVACGPG